MKQLLLILSLFLISNCENNNSKDFKLKIQSSNKTIKLNDTINIEISNKKDILIDSIKLFINDKSIKKEVILNDYILGNHNVKAFIYSNGKSFTLNESFDIYSNITPTLYRYEIINEFNLYAFLNPTNPILFFISNIGFFISPNLFIITPSTGQESLPFILIKFPEVAKFCAALILTSSSSRF